MEDGDFARYIVRLQRLLARRPRFTASEGEEWARGILGRELEEAGLTPSLEAFEARVYEVEECGLAVVKPWRGEVECSPVGFSGSTSGDGVEAELVYVEAGDRALVPDAKDWVGLAAARPREPEVWGYLAERASGLVVSEGSPYRELSTACVPYEWYERYGDLPAVMVRFDDALRLMEAERVRLVLRQRVERRTAYNVVAEVRGSKYPGEVVLLCAHYDSVRGGRGAVDNAGGTAFAVALARAFAGVEVKRTLRLVLFSGEELGLVGSRAYVAAHRDELDEVKLVVNLDVHGGVLGTNAAIVTANEEVASYLKALSRSLGVGLDVKEDVMSSDSASFAREGVPAVNFYRSSGANQDSHTARDDGRYVGEAAYTLLWRLVYRFLSDLLQAEEFPLPREISENVRKSVNRYFKRLLAED
ncbi:MAG: hypothetical protein DRJ67_07935 [Thermoprotei archaeon]|nr:MAG: hypothetical protein DRJ67_07935 [Thermoprotei archaeon]